MDHPEFRFYRPARGQDPSSLQGYYRRAPTAAEAKALLPDGGLGYELDDRRTPWKPGRPAQERADG